MNLCGLCFSQTGNLKLQGFLPYQTNKDRSQKNLPTITKKIPKKKCYDPCLFGRAEILVIFGWLFGRNEFETMTSIIINSF
jgi:hypothetical protein